AMAEFRRFRALARQAGAETLHAIATAAAREAENGPEFIERAEEVLGTQIHVLSGKQEAQFAALGVLSGFVPADGIAGDLGGGSLELIDIDRGDPGTSATLPLGGLRLKDRAQGDLAEARRIIAEELDRAAWISAARGRPLYAIGGIWRNLGLLHMSETRYPLHVRHHYAMAP